MGLENRENQTEFIQNPKSDLIAENIENKNILNLAISEKYELDKSSWVLDLAHKVENDRQQLDKDFNIAWEFITWQCKLDLSNFKFDIINEKFWNNQDIKKLYYELKNELDIDIFQTLKAYDDYICKYLKFPEWREMSKLEYNKLIKNVQTIIIMELSKLNEKLLELREDNNGSLEWMQWIINWAIESTLEPVRESVMSSAQFYLEMQNQDVKNILSDKIGKLHVNMRMREIQEAFVDKQLMIHHKDGFFDFHEESDYTKQIDEIPKDIIRNDSFLTANKVRNSYRDLYLVNNDINFDGSTITQDIASLEHISVLNEKDKQTELEYMVSWLALELFLALPFIGTANSILNSVTWDDINIDFIKSVRPDLDQSYQVETTWWDRLIEVWAAGLGLVGMRSLAKSWQIAEFFEAIAAAGISKWQLFKSMWKMSWHLWINMEQLQKFFQMEQVVVKEKNIYDRWNSQIKKDISFDEIKEALSQWKLLDPKKIIAFWKLDDMERMDAIKSYFPELKYTQIHDVVTAHHMPGNLFSHSKKEVIAKMRFLIEDAKIPGTTVKKIMDMWLAGKVSHVSEMFRLDVPELMKNLENLKELKKLKKLPDYIPNDFTGIKTQDFAIIQNRQFLAWEMKSPTAFSRDIKVEGETFITIRATDKLTLDIVADNIKVMKKEQLDFTNLYDKELKGDKIVTDVYSKEALYNAMYKAIST